MAIVGIVLALAAVLVLVFVGASVLVTFLVRRYGLSTERLEIDQGPTGDLFMAAVAGLYGVLVAFILSVSLDRFDEARRTLTGELNELATLVSLAAGFPPPVQQELRQVGRQYFEALKTGAQGQDPSHTQQVLERLWGMVAGFGPGTDGEANVHQVALATLGELAKQRRLRILHGQRGIPGLVWGVLVFGGLLAVVLSSVARIEPLGLHLGLVAGLATLIAVSLFTIYVLSRPYVMGFAHWFAQNEDLLQGTLWP